MFSQIFILIALVVFAESTTTGGYTGASLLREHAARLVSHANFADGLSGTVGDAISIDSAVLDNLLSNLYRISSDHTKFELLPVGTLGDYVRTFATLPGTQAFPVTWQWGEQTIHTIGLVKGGKWPCSDPNALFEGVLSLFTKEQLNPASGKLRTQDSPSIYSATWSGSGGPVGQASAELICDQSTTPSSCKLASFLVTDTRSFVTCVKEHTEKCVGIGASSKCISLISYLCYAGDNTVTVNMPPLIQTSVLPELLEFYGFGKLEKSCDCNPPK